MREKHTAFSFILVFKLYLINLNLIILILNKYLLKKIHFHYDKIY